MAGHMVLLNLFGGIALLLWATRFVKTGILRAFGEQLRRAIGTATRNRVSACLTGLGVATAVQSSSATALLLVAFAERGLIALAPALAVMLGADIGSTLVVQVLSFQLAALVPALLIVGVLAHGASGSATLRQLGRVVIGLALLIIALGMISGASQPLRDSPLTAMLLRRLGSDPILALMFGALLGWLLHSSVATVLLIMSLVGAGVLDGRLAMALVLGANVGAGLIPLGLSMNAPAMSKRILVGNLGFRLLGALLALGWIDPLASLMAGTSSDPVRQLANFHVLFNLALAAVFLPLTDIAARLLTRYIAEGGSAAEPAGAMHLDEAALDRPVIALGNATRELMRLADLVEIMLRETILTFAEADDKRRLAISEYDNRVDELQESIKLYLTRLSRRPLSAEEGQRCFDLILFTTNLEHVGDIIDKSLLQLAAKKSRNRLEFSQAGWAEIVAMHQRVVDQMRLAVTVFVTRDVAMARELIAEKDRLRLAEKEATSSHLQRLRDGTPASLETSALHLDILRDLKRINAHLTSVAHPILEANGELSQSRLRTEGAEAKKAKPAKA